MSKLSQSINPTLSLQPGKPGKQKPELHFPRLFGLAFMITKNLTEKLEYGEGMCDRLSSGY